MTRKDFSDAIWEIIQDERDRGSDEPGNNGMLTDEQMADGLSEIIGFLLGD